MTAPNVSIIVPVYNAASYLRQCLDSILGQSFRDFEAILVNDGSTDGSLDICRTYAQADGRFLVIDKPNTGVSDSRNAALKLARGRYLQFADSDDWLTPDATETMYRTAERVGADLVVCHFYRVAGERAAQQGHIKKERILTRTDYAEEMMKAPANYYYGVLWNKLYRRSIVEADRLFFDPAVKWSEDFLFNLEYLERARLIAAVPTPVYYYRKREDSLINSQANLRKLIAMKKSTFNEYKELYQKLDLYDEQKAGVYRYLLSAAVDGAVGPLAPKLSASPEAEPHPFKLPERK